MTKQQSLNRDDCLFPCLSHSSVPDSSDETAMRKRRLCVKTSPRADAKTAVYDIQITTKSKYQLIDYKCLW